MADLHFRTANSICIRRMDANVWRPRNEEKIRNKDLANCLVKSYEKIEWEQIRHMGWEKSPKENERQSVSIGKMWQQLNHMADFTAKWIIADSPIIDVDDDVTSKTWTLTTETCRRSYIMCEMQDTYPFYLVARAHARHAFHVQTQRRRIHSLHLRWRI